MNTITKARAEAVKRNIATTKIKQGIKIANKTNAEMRAELAAGGHELPSGRLNGDSLKAQMTQHGLLLTKEDISFEIVGWVGQQKGLKQVLWETGCWIDPGKGNRYHKNPAKEDLDADGNIKEDCKQYVLGRLMANRPDFLNEPTDLEHLASKLSDDRCRITILFTPKYHPNIAGEGVEDVWGFVKRIIRRSPINQRRIFKDFVRLVNQEMSQVSKIRTRRFRRKCRKYMLGYLATKSQVVELKEGKSAKSFKATLDEFVRDFYKPTEDQCEKLQFHKRVWVKKAPVAGAMRRHFSNDAQTSIAVAFANGQKRIRGVKAQKQETKGELEAKSDKPVDMAKMQKTRKVHRSNLDIDSAFIENEIRLSRMEEDGVDEDTVEWWVAVVNRDADIVGVADGDEEEATADCESIGGSDD